MSANELARYMVATDTGKIGIIRRARESGTPVRTRYKDARTAIREALCAPANEKRIIAAARDALEQRADDPALSDFARDDAEKSAEALTAFANLRNQLAGHNFIEAPAKQPKLILAGVEISVHCDVLIERTYRGVDQRGAALLRLTKPEEDETETASDKRREVGQFAATLVHMHLARSLAGNKTPYHGLCWSIDVQNGDVHAAPRTYLSRATNLENACRFIAAMWDRA